MLWNCSAQLHGGRHTSKQVNHASPEPMTPSPSHAPSIQEEPPLSDPETNLAEIAAPPPIYDRSEKATRHEQYLENQRSQYKQSEGDPEQPVATENHHEKSTVR